MDVHHVLPFASYGPGFRLARKIADRGFRPASLAKYRALQEKNARVLVARMLENPEGWVAHVELSVSVVFCVPRKKVPTTQLRSLCFFFFSFRFQGEQLLAMTYDYEVKGPDDGFLDAAEKLSDLVSRASLPGSLLVNELPFCTSLPSDPSDRGSRLPRKCYQVRHIPEWLPWFSYRPLARLGHTLADELTNEPMQFVRKSMVSGELHGVWAEGLTMPCIA
jgi:hypothetical protein